MSSTHGQVKDWINLPILSVPSCSSVLLKRGAFQLNDGMKRWMVTFIVGDGVDGLTIRHRMERPGSEPAVGIPLPFIMVLVPDQIFRHWVPGFFPGSKAVGA